MISLYVQPVSNGYALFNVYINVIKTGGNRFGGSCIFSEKTHFPVKSSMILSMKGNNIFDSIKVIKF